MFFYLLKYQVLSGPIWAPTQSVTCGCKGDFAGETWEWFFDLVYTGNKVLFQVIRSQVVSATVHKVQDWIQNVLWSDHLNHICSQNGWSDIGAAMKHLLTCQSTTELQHGF